VIHQAILCDICGTEKKQTNHWYVASDHAGELRVSRWNTRNQLSSGLKHLCGQTCVHKLVDEFMAETLDARALPAAANEAVVVEETVIAGAGLASNTAYEEFESSARLLPPLEPINPERSMPVRPRRAEAWNRERTPHAGKRRPDSTVRRRSK
jgi:hypothetical protein